MPSAPTGVTWDEHLPLNASRWAFNERHLPVVWCINDDYFSSLQWEVARLNASSRTMEFGRGGAQTGQASAFCGPWCVSNVLEELDAAGEYFYYPSDGAPDYWLNATSELRASIVAPQL